MRNDWMDLRNPLLSLLLGCVQLLPKQGSWGIARMVLDLLIIFLLVLSWILTVRAQKRGDEAADTRRTSSWMNWALLVSLLLYLAALMLDILGMLPLLRLILLGVGAAGLPNCTGTDCPPYQNLDGLSCLFGTKLSTLPILADRKEKVMNRYLEAALFPGVLILLGITWILPDDQLVWLIAAVVLDLLLLAVLVWYLIRRRKTRRPAPEGESKRTYTWQYWTYRVLFTLAAACYLIGGLVNLILDFAGADAGWCVWLFVAGLVAAAISLPLALWDEAIDPA